MDTDKLKALVKTAVKLAIIRHDLEMDDCTDMDEEWQEAIADDTWDALNGVGTCADEMDPDLKALCEEQE